jgi:nucleoside-diphosphate-sugar epimerase
MSSPKKFVVFAATGDQGSSVCKFLVKEGYHVVGITRNPDGEKAKCKRAFLGRAWDDIYAARSDRAARRRDGQG